MEWADGANFDGRSEDRAGDDCAPRAGFRLAPSPAAIPPATDRLRNLRRCIEGFLVTRSARIKRTIISPAAICNHRDRWHPATVPWSLRTRRVEDKEWDDATTCPVASGRQAKVPQDRGRRH